jgi:hypothetical protein
MAQRGRRSDGVNDDLLETQEFYEMCQRYRHASGLAVVSGAGADASLTASEAFEQLKGWIRGNFKQAPCMPYDRERTTVVHDARDYLKNPITRGDFGPAGEDGDARYMEWRRSSNDKSSDLRP